jgi:hypothetical protein
MGTGALELGRLGTHALSSKSPHLNLSNKNINKF